MHLILRLHAAIYASCPQSRETLHGGHCHHHQHLEEETMPSAVFEKSKLTAWL